VLFVGLDLGGTNVKGVVADDRGEVLESRIAATDRSSPTAAVASASRLGAELAGRYPDVRGVGITVPGRFDAEGRGVHVPNIPGDWRGVPIRAAVAEAVGRPAQILNDARAFGLAESRFGAARGAATAVGLVLGTGIGGALIVGGRLVTGRTGGAGEIGHQILLVNGPACGCGNRGCLEALARSDVFAARAGVADVPEVVSAVQRGDPKAREAVEVTAHWIAVGLANVITLINPEVVFLGGGVMQCGEILLEPIRRFLPGLTPFVDPGSYRLVPGRLGPIAGALGAVAWSWECARDQALGD